MLSILNATNEQTGPPPSLIGRRHRDARRFRRAEVADAGYFRRQAIGIFESTIVKSDSIANRMALIALAIAFGTGRTSRAALTAADEGAPISSAHLTPSPCGGGLAADIALFRRASGVPILIERPVMAETRGLWQAETEREPLKIRLIEIAQPAADEWRQGDPRAIMVEFACLIRALPIESRGFT